MDLNFNYYYYQLVPTAALTPQMYTSDVVVGI